MNEMAKQPEMVYFNSHTREGVTYGNVYFVSTIEISTHTPVRV